MTSWISETASVSTEQLLDIVRFNDVLAAVENTDAG